MSLPTCQCNAGLPVQQQLANIYCALLSIQSGSGVAYPLSPTLGGTGIANAAGETITIGGGFGLTLTLTGATNVTLPTSGTIQVFNQSLNTADSVSFNNVTADIVSGTLRVNGDAQLFGVITGSDTNTSTTGAAFVGDGVGGGIWGATPAADGTYANPTSITIVNGIITAIS